MKRTFMALFCAAMVLPASAQWNPGDNSLTQIAKKTNIEYNSPAMIRKADGTTIIAYRTFGFQTNPETGQQEDERHFYLYLQMLDKDGNKMWGDDGVLVSSKPTDITAYGHVNLDTLSNGNIIVTHADPRDAGSSLEHLKIKPIKIFAYCYDQQGQSVWSKDGVMLPYHIMDPTSHATAYVGEELVVSGDKIYLASAILEQFVEGLVETFVHYFEVACLDYNGNILTERHDSVCQAFTYAIAPAPDGDAYLIYVNDKDGYSAERIGSDCKNKWSAVMPVDTTSVVSRDGTSVISNPPTELIPMSDGSVGLVYKAFLPRHLSQNFYNRLYPDGSMLAEHVLLSDTVGYDHDHVIMVEGDTLNVFQCVEVPRMEYGQYYLYLNRILLDGTRLLPDYTGYWLDKSTGLNTSPICIVKADGNYNVLFSALDYYTGSYQPYCYTISADGKMFQRKVIMGNVYIDDIVFATEDNYAYLLFGRDPLGQHGLWISCIDATDYTNSKALTAELPGKFTVSADGKQVIFSQGNLQYLPRHATYIFASHQFEAQDELNRWISDNSLDWEDLFGWGTGDNPINVSTNDADYPNFNEWGNNVILNSTYEAGTWRTLTKDEWDYLLNGRPNAAQKRTIGSITMGAYAPVRGMFLLPDTIQMPQDLPIDMDAKSWDINVCGPDTLRRLEEAGVVFLPADGYRVEVEIYDIDKTDRTDRGYNCYYWTSTESGADKAQMLYISTDGASFDAKPRSQGMSVRLVKDAGTQPSAIDRVGTQKQNIETRKVMMNGVLYILRDGKLYNAQGARVQ